MCINIMCENTILEQNVSFNFGVYRPISFSFQQQTQQKLEQPQTTALTLMEL